METKRFVMPSLGFYVILFLVFLSTLMVAPQCAEAG